MDFIILLRLLGFEQAVEVFADAREMEEPAAVDIAFAAEVHGLYFAFRHQIVEGAALDTEMTLHIAPTAKFGECVGGGAYRADWFCCYCFHISFKIL